MKETEEQRGSGAREAEARTLWWQIGPSILPLGLPAAEVCHHASLDPLPAVFLFSSAYGSSLHVIGRRKEGKNTDEALARAWPPWVLL